MIQPKNNTKELLFSITKNCETLIKQTHRKAEETLEFKLAKQREKFRFKPPNKVEGSWMLKLTSLEVHKSIFKRTEENYKFEIYTQTLDNEFSFTGLKDKVAEALCLADFSIEVFKHELHGPDIN